MPSRCRFRLGCSPGRPVGRPAVAPRRRPCQPTMGQCCGPQAPHHGRVCPAVCRAQAHRSQRGRGPFKRARGRPGGGGLGPLALRASPFSPAALERPTETLEGTVDRPRVLPVGPQRERESVARGQRGRGRIALRGRDRREARDDGDARARRPGVEADVALKAFRPNCRIAVSAPTRRPCGNSLPAWLLARCQPQRRDEPVGQQRRRVRVDSGEPEDDGARRWSALRRRRSRRPQPQTRNRERLV